MLLGKTTFAKGRPFELETARFRLRTLRPADASQRWQEWLADPEVVHPINAEVRRVTLQELATYIAQHDNYARFLVGIFEKTSGLHIGFFFIEVDRTNQNATFNVLIGDKSWWGKGAVNEARAALLDYFFDRMGMAKICGSPLSRNFPAIFNYKAQGWVHEGTLRFHYRSVLDGSRLDQLRFRLMPDEWRRVRDKGRGK